MSTNQKAVYILVGVLISGILLIGVNAMVFAGTSIKENRLESTLADKAAMLLMIQKDTEIQEALQEQRMVELEHHKEHETRITVLEVTE